MKKILALILSLTMLFTMSVTVFADEGVTTPEDFMNKLNDSTTTEIILGCDISVTGQLSLAHTTEILKDCTINLGKYTLDLTLSPRINIGNENTKSNVKITGTKGYATIKYSNYSTDSVFEVKNGTLDVSNIEFKYEKTNVNGEDYANSIFQVYSNSTLNVSDCVFGTEENKVKTSLGVTNANVGGTVNVTNSSMYVEGVAIFGGNQTITDCTIKGNPAIKVANSAHIINLNGNTTVTGGVDNRGATINNNVAGLELEAVKRDTTDDEGDSKTYYYSTLADAVEYAKDGDTITLLKDLSGDGIKIEPNTFGKSGITIDLGGKTYTVSGKAVGSTNSQTNGFQFNKGNNITIKNGKIDSAEECDNINSNGPIRRALSILIQNYSNLTLDEVYLDGSKLLTAGWTPCTLSCCNGTSKIKDCTITTTNNGYSFGLYGRSEYDGVEVTVENITTTGFVLINPKSVKDHTLKSGSNIYTEVGDYIQNGTKFAKVNKTDIDGRSIEVYADKTEVKAGEDVTVTVKLKGDKLAYAKYELSYDEDLFILKNDNCDIVDNNGTIALTTYSGTSEFVCGKDGYTLATYTFTAKAQSAAKTGDFKLDKTIAYTYNEALNNLDNLAVSNNDKVSVTVKLGEYTATIKVDGTVVTEASKELPYDGKKHTVDVVVAPSSYKEVKITCTKDGNEVSNTDSFKEIGKYVISYTVVAPNGYDSLTGTFTLKITAPTAYYVEVNTNNASENKGNDYVAGKKLVLVYTDLDGVAFKYGGYDMVNVSKAINEYEYVKENGSDNTITQTNFKYVYAYVTDAIENGTVDSYKNKITSFVIENGYKVPNINETPYDEDINISMNLSDTDTVTAYGVWGGKFFDDATKQLYILKADVNGDKTVDGKDIQRVDLAVRNSK